MKSLSPRTRTAKSSDVIRPFSARINSVNERESIIKISVWPFILLLLCLMPNGNLIAESPHVVAANKPATKLEFGPSMVLGGCGGAYFLASPGELVIDVEKCDLNRSSRKTELRAILVGPDRRVIQEVSIPDDGNTSSKRPGPRQSVRLATTVKHKGVYGLNITVSNDRYGDHFTWGFRTNCPRYCIETARGHRDARHLEPIVLRDVDTAGDICFVPRLGKLKIDVSGLSKRVKELDIFDADGKTLATMPVDSNRNATHTFAANVPRDSRPWRLHLPARQATVEIDGLTRWDKGDQYPDMAIWTCDPAAFFPLAKYRWLLSPYRETAYVQADSHGKRQFTLHNNSPQNVTIRLALEFPDGAWPAELSTASLALRPQERQQVTVRYQAPPQGKARSVHLRATPAEDPDFSTYSTLTISSRPPAKSNTLKTPIWLRPYKWESEPFGNRPCYPLGSQPYFDIKNRPFIYIAPELYTLRDGISEKASWQKTDLRKAVKSWTPPQTDWSFDSPSAKVAFDCDNDVYLLSHSDEKGALLHSSDGSRTFHAYVLPGKLPGSRGYDIEQFSGHNTPDGPPPLVRYILRKKDPKRIWRRLCRLELFVPQKDKRGRISLGDPIKLTDKCLGISSHSGIPSTVVSCDGKVHITWAEATDPTKKVPGAPTYVATYDKATKTLSKPVLVAYGPPANDVHNTPSITLDSRGYLHVLAGTHGRPFPYTRSLQPNDSTSGWTEAVTLGNGLRQTYMGLVCGTDDTLHTAFRLWGFNEEPFPLSHHARIATQSKAVDDREWQAPQKILAAAFSEYSVFYHRLTIDRRGRLFLSYKYWSTHWFYRNDHFHANRSLLISDDGATTWRFASEEDFRPNSQKSR